MDIVSHFECGIEITARSLNNVFRHLILSARANAVMWWNTRWPVISQHYSGHIILKAFSLNVNSTRLLATLIMLALYRNTR